MNLVYLSSYCIALIHRLIQRSPSSLALAIHPSVSGIEVQPTPQPASSENSPAAFRQLARANNHDSEPLTYSPVSSLHHTPTQHAPATTNTPSAISHPHPPPRTPRDRLRPPAADSSTSLPPSTTPPRPRPRCPLRHDPANVLSGNHRKVPRETTGQSPARGLGEYLGTEGGLQGEDQ
jgi:hypothetical protein